MQEVLLAHGGPDALPPPLTPSGLLTAWEVEPLLVLGLLAAALLYLAGVRRLAARGVAWSGWRTVLWLTGLATIGIATSSAVGVYDTTLFSMHAVQHMLLQMVAPVPLGMAAPVTLALRALPRRPRQWLLAVLHSPPARVLSHPLVGFGVFVVTPFVLYYSSLYEMTLRSDLLHNLNHVHFVLVGCLFYWPLLGVDPFPHRLPYLFRFLLFLGLAPMHVLLGVPIMMRTDVMAETFYLELGRDWGPSLLTDQSIGGGIMWVFADVVSLVFVAAFARQWVRHERRETARTDRQLDRIHGDSPTTRPWWEQDARSAVTRKARAAGTSAAGTSPADAAPRADGR